MSITELPIPALEPAKRSTIPAVEPQPETSAKLYPVVWRWHFYAGLLLAPVLWVITLTGAIYVFRTELTEWRDRAILTVAPQSQRLGYDELRKIAVHAAGTDDIEALAVTADSSRSIQFVAHVHEEEHGANDKAAEERHMFVYLNPYTGEVLDRRIREDDFFMVVLDLHRTLWLGSTGRVISELTTSWGVILLLTGLYLWWPRGKKNVGVFIPKLKGKFYAVLRDLHAVSGFYLLPILILVTATGLFFSLVWGTGYNSTAKAAGHWPPQWFAPPKSPPAAADAKPLPLDRAVATFLEHSRPDDVVTIRLAASPEVAHKAFYMRDEDKNSLKTVSVDQYTAQTVKSIDVSELPLMYRIRVWAVSIHMGQIFGTPTKILALLASLGMFALSATGIWMWWKRRPTGRTGFPRRPLAGSLPGWGWALVVLIGILMPVAGASMLLMGLIDFTTSRLRRNRAVAAGS